MKGELLFIGPLLLASMCFGQTSLFEARIRTGDGANIVEFVQAADTAGARRIVAAMHPEGRVQGIHRRPSAEAFTWFRALLSVDGVNVMDTAMARGSGPARRVFDARYHGLGRIVSLIELRDTSGVRLFQGTVHGVGSQSFRDAVLATSAGNARKALVARYPTARISSVTQTK